MDASRAAKMTDTKNVASMEVPEGKLMKKVSECAFQNKPLQCPSACHLCPYGPKTINYPVRTDWHGHTTCLFTTFKLNSYLGLIVFIAIAFKCLCIFVK